MKCSNCGFETNDTVKFCPECGTALNNEQAVEEVPETPAIEEKEAEAIAETPVTEEKVEVTPTVTEEKTDEAPKSAFAMETTTTTTPVTTAPSYYSNSGSDSTYNSTIVEPTEAASNGMAIGSLVCGIVSLVMCCCCTCIGPIVGIVGIVLGCLQKKDEYGKKPTMATVGIILSSVGVALSIICIIFAVASGAFSAFMENL